MRIHFVYAGDANDQRVQAPYSITRNLFNFLSSKCEVIYHQWDACYDIDIGPDDILLGHPNYDHNTVVQRVFRQQRPVLAKFLIHPFHHRRVSDNFPFDELVTDADAIFPICGHYWIDSIETTPFKHWRDKMIHVDMAVDLNHYSYFRTGFNPIGQRRLLYVGSSMPQKNLSLMEAIMRKLPHIKLDWYGGYTDHPLDKLPNVTTVGWSDLTQDLLRKLVVDCDIFINTSVSDACPTAMLEAMSIGFPTACTAESGLSNHIVTQLKLDDVDYNVHSINWLLNLPEASLLDRAKETRTYVEHNHTWHDFCNRVWSGMAKVIMTKTGRDINHL